MRISVINLERSVERRQQMHAQLTALGLAHEFFAAIDAARGQLEGVSRYDEARALRVLGHALTPAEVGCFASHYLLWQRCAELGEPLVVMEDDVLIDADLASVLLLVARRLEACGLIRLAGLADRYADEIADLGGGRKLARYRKGPRGTQCYALHPKAARALLRRADTWIDAVDLYLDAFWLHGVPSYAVLPHPVRHLPEAEAASLIGAGRWGRRRSGVEKLRRELTHMLWSLKRYWFNLRYRAPQFSGP